ncbi:MAG: DUF4326 domain-containing protein [bacterium]|nr:DUF4326 domain-containing protein [bacterium]
MSITVVNVYSYRPMLNDTRVYIGRASSWSKASSMVKDMLNLSVLGNKEYVDPSDDVARELSVKAYGESLPKKAAVKGSKFREALSKIYWAHKNGQDVKLVCFCAPKTCHGDAIKAFIFSYDVPKPCRECGNYLDDPQCIAKCKEQDK